MKWQKNADKEDFLFMCKPGDGGKARFPTYVLANRLGITARQLTDFAKLKEIYPIGFYRGYSGVGWVPLNSRNSYLWTNDQYKQIKRKLTKNCSFLVKIRCRELERKFGIKIKNKTYSEYKKLEILL